MVTIGIDIGGTNLRIGCVSEQGELSGYEKVGQREVLAGDPVRGLSRFLEDYLERHGLCGRVCGLAAGLPATLDRENTTVLSAPNLEGMDGVALGSRLQERLGLPVYLLKDVSALFYYDCARFSLPKDCVAIGCYIGTGIGNAIYLNGSLYGGANGSAGELGHIPVWDSAEPCGCGNRGCMETLVGGKGLDRIRAEGFPDTEMRELFLRHKDAPVLRQYVEHLALPIATEINILDPGIVILGGGVLSMEGFPAEQLVERIRLHARKPYPEKALQFLFSHNAGENGVIGAGLYTWAQLAKKAVPA
ncbi:MAG: allose kinase [Hominenteromicrobium sp.]